jgi:hypothetical protein
MPALLWSITVKTFDTWQSILHLSMFVGACFRGRLAWSHNKWPPSGTAGASLPSERHKTEDTKGFSGPHQDRGPCPIQGSTSEKLPSGHHWVPYESKIVSRQIWLRELMVHYIMFPYSSNLLAHITNPQGWQWSTRLLGVYHQVWVFDTRILQLG